MPRDADDVPAAGSTVDDRQPAWSPDGSQIAGDAGGSSIFVINADGANERRLADRPRLLSAPETSRSCSATLLAEFTTALRDGLFLACRRHLCQHDERMFVAAFTALLPQPSLDWEIRFRDRVRLPAGDTGTVIGFYRDTETALILLDTGDRLTVSLDDLDAVG